jgi:hypothetical protein
MREAPERSHVLIAKFGADTAERLADELRVMADQIDREKLSTGCSGSPSGGAIYSYKIRPEQTHDVYFAQIEDWLAERKNPAPQTNMTVTDEMVTIYRSAVRAVFDPWLNDEVEIPSDAIGAVATKAGLQAVLDTLFATTEGQDNG